MDLYQNRTRTIQVRNRFIGAGQPIFLTAEIGAAHNGDVEKARVMIEAAAKAGCDGADIFMASPEDYMWTGDFGRGHGFDIMEAWRKLAFTEEQWAELLELGKKHDIIVYPTPLDLVSVERCRRLGVEMMNINSDDVNNPFLLKAAASLGVPLTLHDINISITEMVNAVKTLQEAGNRDIIVLHSTREGSGEDNLFATADLEVINTYRQIFGATGVLAGCVEHTTSDFLIYAVAALQPALISRHIQICAEDNPADAGMSVDVPFLSEMIKKVRHVERAMGCGNTRLVMGDVPKEIAANTARRKVLVAAKDIPRGKRIAESDLNAKRPGHRGGVNPMAYIHIVGSIAKTDIPADSVLKFEMFDELQEAPYKYPAMDRA